MERGSCRLLGMAAFETTTEFDASANYVFGEIADYTKAELWNPAYVSVDQVDGNGAHLGARYAVIFTFYGRQFDLEYEVVDFVAGERLVLEASSRRVQARDEIVVKQNGAGSLVHRSAEFAFTGPLRLLDGGLQVAFESMSKRAAVNMAEQLSAA